jgi:ankyrin repeat protein
VNARTAFGATPLLWSVASLEKVQLLVMNGAEVNARSKMGNTALTAAAAQAGNFDVVRYLLDHGASVSTARNEGLERPVLKAARANDLELARLLIKAGDDAAARDSRGFTPLMYASAAGNVEMIKVFLANHANVNAQMEPHLNVVKNGPIGIGRLSPLMLASVSRNPAAVKLLLGAGADINARDIRGMTPLMLAVASDHADPEIVRFLLENNPDLTIKSELGETAEMWAAKFRTRAARPLRRDASATPEDNGVVTGSANTESRDARTAAEQGMALIQKSTRTFFRNGGCVSCHAQDVTGMAVGIARKKGLRLDESAAADVLRTTRLEFASRSDQFLERMDGPADIILTAALFALSTQEVPPDRMTDAMVRNIASHQQREGSWSGFGIVRPPTSDWRISETAQAIRVLRYYAPAALKSEMDARIARALAWLKNERAVTTEDAVMQLLGAKWAGADAFTINRFTQNVLVLQREDGGWAQTRELRCDAYATGTALYALHEAGISPDGSPFRRGAAFLLKTQAADGSWHVTSRAPKFQPYFDGGFPYGHDQWISQWATGWATIALTLSTPEHIVALQ